MNKYSYGLSIFAGLFFLVSFAQEVGGHGIIGNEPVDYSENSNRRQRGQEGPDGYYTVIGKAAEAMALRAKNSPETIVFNFKNKCTLEVSAILFSSSKAKDLSGDMTICFDRQAGFSAYRFNRRKISRFVCYVPAYRNDPNPVKRPRTLGPTNNCGGDGVKEISGAFSEAFDLFNLH